MTKEIGFDLEFGSEPSVTPLSERGEIFCDTSLLYCEDMASIYRCAVNAGLHVRFDTAQTRDKLTAD
jgi:hypothetical protein